MNKTQVSKTRTDTAKFWLENTINDASFLKFCERTRDRMQDRLSAEQIKELSELTEDPKTLKEAVVFLMVKLIIENDPYIIEKLKEPTSA